MTIEVKNDAMLGRTTDSTLHIELIKLQQENNQLKEVIEEVREKVNKKLRDVNLTYGIDNEFREEYDDLLQILDKVK
jgi:hypothetical protein